MKLCYKCKKRPAVVFISDPTNPSADPQGLCLMCAKESGIKPIDDMLKKMNISDEDIEQMSDQFMDIMSIAETEDGEDAFSLGTAPAFPFLNNIFGAPAKEEQTENNDLEKSDKSDKEKKKSKKRRYLDQYCINLTEKAKNGKLDNIIGRDNELYRAIQILSRRSKNNPCLIGEPGVGKTAIAEGLALKIASGEAPARLLDKEIPHGIAVVIEDFKESDKLIDIRAEIYCEKASHKKIIIGKDGAMLKRVGSFAREDLETFFGVHVNINLWVKVKENWRDNEMLLGSFGFKKD